LSIGEACDIVDIEKIILHNIDNLDFKKREYIPNIEKIREEVLSHITDKKVKQELEQEAEHPFPCIITLEAIGKEQCLTTITSDKKPAHIPFEDLYSDTFHGEDIIEVRVPKK